MSPERFPEKPKYSLSNDMKLLDESSLELNNYFARQGINHSRSDIERRDALLAYFTQEIYFDSLQNYGHLLEALLKSANENQITDAAIEQWLLTYVPPQDGNSTWHRGLIKTSILTNDINNNQHKDTRSKIDNLKMLVEKDLIDNDTNYFLKVTKAIADAEPYLTIRYYEISETMFSPENQIVPTEYILAKSIWGRSVQNIEFMTMPSLDEAHSKIRTIDGQYRDRTISELFGWCCAQMVFNKRLKKQTSAIIDDSMIIDPPITYLRLDNE